MSNDRATAFRLTFWGTRGSIPTPGPATNRYGGNTACLEIRAGDELIILDAGSGIRELGLQLARWSAGQAMRGSILITHTHWDHIQGLPFFSPIYNPKNTFHIYGASGMDANFKTVLHRQMDPSYFPVALDDLGASLEFREINGPRLTIGDTEIATTFTNHPGICLAFRMTRHGRSIVYYTDNEPYQKINASRKDKGAREFAEELDKKVVEFTRDADLFIYDGQYTEEEYKTKVGWGHSTVDDAVALGVGASARSIAIFHHDPLHDDEFIDRMVEHGKALAKSLGSSAEVFGAREGHTIDI